MSLRKTRLNRFEHFYFEHFFGTDVKRLIAFRKSLRKELKSGKWRGSVKTYRTFKLKGGETCRISINHHMVDIYMKEISNSNPNASKRS